MAPQLFAAGREADRDVGARLARLRLVLSDSAPFGLAVAVQVGRVNQPHEPVFELDGLELLPFGINRQHGALQAANVLRSQQAVQMSVFVIRAFVKMRETLLGTRDLAKKLAVLEKKLTARLDTHETAIVQVLRELMQILNPPPLTPSPPEKKQIGFHP